MPDGRIRSNPIWPIGLGAGLIVLGLICVYRVFLIPSDNVLLIGVLMLVAGVAEGLQAVFGRQWNDFVSELAPALLYVVVGVMILASPLSGTFVLTLIMAAAFITGVVYRIASSWREERMTGWHMLIVASVVSLLVWLVLLWTWPASARWVLGSVAAAGLFLTGYNWVKRGLAAREAHESM